MSVQIPLFMFRTLQFLLLGIIVNPVNAQFYGDIRFGIHPHVGDDGSTDFHIGSSIGWQFNQHLGFGLSFEDFHFITESTGTQLQTLGLQYRRLNASEKVAVVFEVGSLLKSDYYHDLDERISYFNKLDPYLRFKCSRHFGRFELGGHLSYFSPYRESIDIYDQSSDSYLPSGVYQERDHLIVALFIGLLLDW